MKKSTNQPQDKKAEYLSQIITCENIQKLGEQTAQKALKTIHRKSQDKYIYNLIKELASDLKNATHDIDYTFSNAFDLVQIATCFYCEYMGQPLNATANNGELDKNKQPIDIYRACLRNLNRYIMANKSKVYKTLYLQDIDENGEYLEIPQKWDMPTITDFKKVKTAIDNLKLSATEYKVLSARLRGYGYKVIAKKLSISHDNVKTYCKRIQAKAIKIDIMPKAIRKLQTA